MANESRWAFAVYATKEREGRGPLGRLALGFVRARWYGEARRKAEVAAGRCYPESEGWRIEAVGALREDAEDLIPELAYVERR